MFSKSFLALSTMALSLIMGVAPYAKAQDSCLAVLVQARLAITIDNKLNRPIAFSYEGQRYALQPKAKKDFYYTYTAPRCSNTLVYPVVAFEQKSYSLANNSYGSVSYSFYDNNGQMDLSYNSRTGVSVDEFRIREYYRICLGREAESQKVVRTWMQDKNAKDGICGSPESKIPEVQEKAVRYAYEKCLGREVESQDSLNYWLGVTRSASPLVMHEAICASPEANQGLN